MVKLEIAEQIEIPEGVEVKIDAGLVSAKGPKGEASRKLVYPRISIETKDSKIILSSKKATKREKRIIGTFKSHIQNILQGVIEVHSYKLKVCSTHFPMTAAVENNEFVVQNFLGEKVPRKFKIKQGVDIKVEGQEITVESADKELAGQAAASIEQLCRITKRDRRIFQDGIYIIKKSEKAR
ncbi:50S ribosomal protein L6 [Candidatus Woesearchaeota archaeon]|nr:50S ribosomal protein L6 [Candidatus Woesearchaeota archaeon]